ncbi:MAG: BON domain-containing protein [Pirellulaceae bacterium]|nr:BON domain-containing protein [Pirellulaceae bacterium]
MTSKVPDNQLTRAVTMKLAQRSGGSGCKVSAAVANGYVTITGSVEAEYQKRPIINAVNGINGVRRVIDQLVVVPKKKRE